MKRFAKILAAIGSLLLLFSVGGIVSLAQMLAEPAVKELFDAQSLPTMWFLLTRTDMIWPLIVSLLLLIGALVIGILLWRKRILTAKADKAALKAEKEARKSARKKSDDSDESAIIEE